jgi:hypothetical protein
MATAISLNAASAIINGQGLAANAALASQFTTFQSKPTRILIANIFANAKANVSGNAYSNVQSAVDAIGTGVTRGQWLIDFYPANVSPISSANIFKYGNASSTTSFSAVIKKQAELPFDHGLSGFANIYFLVSGHAQGIFETVSSVRLLQDRTYSEAGIGFTGPLDTITAGLGTNAKLIANVVADWGTMYDINNINQIADPYVFGQNLLNQELGYINGLTDQLQAVGLDPSDLTDVETSITTTTQQETTVRVSTFAGEIEIPTITEVTTTTPVTGSSPTVVVNIYRTITGANLATIVNATGIITSVNSRQNLLSLADYLDLSKVVAPDLYRVLKTDLEIENFEDFGNYIVSRLGQVTFRNWADMAQLLRNIETPALSNLPTGGDTNVLYTSTVTTFNNLYGTGRGPFSNPTIADYLGTTAGMPTLPAMSTINSYYDTLVSSISTQVSNLDRAVVDYVTLYAAYDADYTASNGSPTLSEPSLSIITSNVSALNTALNNIPDSTAYSASTRAYYDMLEQLALEVPNLVKAGVVFTTGEATILNSFAESIGPTASDKKELETYQFFANLITPDQAGDTIRAAVAETINTNILTQAGIQTYNDPEPRSIITQSESQNVSISTYISRNK